MSVISFFQCVSFSVFNWTQNHRYNGYNFRFLNHASWQCSVQLLMTQKKSKSKLISKYALTIPLILVWNILFHQAHSCYTAMTRDLESGSYTHYNDDFVTKYRERTALKNIRNNRYGLVHALVYVQT